MLLLSRKFPLITYVARQGSGYSGCSKGRKPRGSPASAYVYNSSSFHNLLKVLMLLYSLLFSVDECQ